MIKILLDCLKINKFTKKKKTTYDSLHKQSTTGTWQPSMAIQIAKDWQTTSKIKFKYSNKDVFNVLQYTPKKFTHIY